MLKNLNTYFRKNTDGIAEFAKIAIALLMSFIGFISMFNTVLKHVSLSDITGGNVGHSIMSLLKNTEAEIGITFILAAVMIVLSVLQLVSMLLAVLHCAKEKKSNKSTLLSISVVISIILHAISLLLGSVLLNELVSDQNSATASQFMTQIYQPMLWAILLFAVYFTIHVYQNDRDDILKKKIIHATSPVTSFHSVTTLGSLLLSAASIIMPVVQVAPSLFNGHDIVFWAQKSDFAEADTSSTIAIIAIFFAAMAVVLLIGYVITQYGASGKGRRRSIPMLFNAIALGINLMFTSLCMVLYSEAAANMGMLKCSTLCYLPLLVSALVLVAQILYKDKVVQKQVTVTQEASLEPVKTVKEGKYEA